MRKTYLASIIALFLFLSIIAGEIAIASPIPPEVKSVVVFIFIEKDGKLIPNGTGFFVGVKNPSESTTFSVYLITAKHVLFKPDTTEFLDKVYVRINKREGGSEVGPIPVRVDGENKTVFFHNDPTVDVVAMPFLPDQTRFDFKFLPDEIITTEDDYKKLNIREGSDVFFTGLFTPYLGSEKNYPIVRFGRVALVTDEKIEWQGKPMSLYLIEAGSYGGNSGSPVFFYLGSDRTPGILTVGNPVLKLAGVMQGTFRDAQEIKVVETKITPISVSNMGIAAIVPAYKVHELLYSDEMKQRRGF